MAPIVEEMRIIGMDSVSSMPANLYHHCWIIAEKIYGLEPL
jgi:hypothetical protein